jgi:tRNA1(Val) A37 N6-methylase TrmN6
MIKGKHFRKPDISGTVQNLLEGKQRDDGLFVDIGSNVGMATFAAAVMGFQVVAFEPIFENLQRICDGVYLNRVADRVTLFGAAASDRIGDVTIHKVISEFLLN